MKHSQKAAGGLVVARGQTAKLLEAAEKALDFIAVPVQVAVNHALDEAVFLAGNDHRRAKFFDQRHDAVGVIGFVRQYVAGPAGPGQQLSGPAAIRLLARAKHQTQRIAQGIDQGMDFGGQPAAAAAEGLVPDAAFFWLPAAWAWARTTVESSMTQSKSGSCTASNKRCQMPFWAHRRLRLRSVSCLPKRAGSARQAHPWRATQNTALRKSRLSDPVRPTSPALPAICGAKAVQARSLISSILFTSANIIVLTT